MMVTINPCFHWIGYHLTSSLLQEGIEVIGIDPIVDSKSDLLYMYVGRNSNFQHFFQRSDKENHVQQSNDEWEVDLVDDGLLVRQGDTERDWIEIPLLYGEWMDICKTGAKEKDELLQWITDQQATYIGDFMDTFLKSFLDQQPFRLEKRADDKGIVKERVEALWRCELLLQRI
ncbi:hypothetical protein LC065_18960 [Halobacillus litoralis]|uniref:hypothetical protein n=1 Tax=Halobacillus litoralis TaxID=45668 RepID=UPI001CFD7DBD|nr:hypothetical protein [Halobacillus litoralis]WLR47554.1 hypothetical protein LC065_18960 [Halobacillus litoralis]